MLCASFFVSDYVMVYVCVACILLAVNIFDFCMSASFAVSLFYIDYVLPSLRGAAFASE